jgi:hypothetical protein
VSILVVNNTNILVESESAGAKAGGGKRPLGHADPQYRQAQIDCRRQIEQLRRQIGRIVCSGAWADDCLYRGAHYAPDFKCACPRCRSEFPDRLHPRAARESAISGDCQAEMDEDPELAEDLAALRNDRERIGSVFLAAGRTDRGSGRVRR